MIAALLGLVTALSQGIAPEDAARAFALAEELCARDGAKLWGRELYGPMLFLHAPSGTMVANRPDAEGVLAEAAGTQGSVFAGPLADGLGIANTAQRWAGELWTTVVWPVPDAPSDQGRLLLHELFHRLQPAIGACRFAAAACDHLDEKDGRVLLRLELRALADALAREGDARRSAVAAALAARARRHAVHPAAHDAEVALESNEGVAEYTGVRLGGLAPAEQRRYAAARLRGTEGERTFARSFAYATGPAWGLLLDDAEEAGGASWRAAFAGTIDFAERLARALALAPEPDLAAAVEAALERYDGAALVAEEEARDRARQAVLAADRARFVDGPVLWLETGPDVRYTFDPYAVRALPGEGRVYATLSLRDAWGALEVARGGALLRDGETGALATCRVPAPTGEEGARIVGDGWTLVLAEGWSLVPGERDGDLTLAR